MSVPYSLEVLPKAHETLQEINEKYYISCVADVKSVLDVLLPGKYKLRCMDESNCLLDDYRSYLNMRNQKVLKVFLVGTIDGDISVFLVRLQDVHMSSSTACCQAYIKAMFS